MTNYLLAVAAAWFTTSVIAMLGQKIIPFDQPSLQSILLDDKSRKLRFLIRLLGRLASAFVFVYVLHLIAPAGANWLIGLRWGVLAALMFHVPAGLDALATFSFSLKMIWGSAAMGFLEAAAAGAVAGLLL